MSHAAAGEAPTGTYTEGFHGRRLLTFTESLIHVDVCVQKSETYVVNIHVSLYFALLFGIGRFLLSHL